MAAKRKAGRPKVKTPADVVVSVRLPRETVERARRRALEEDRAVAYVLRQAIKRGLE